MAKKQIIYYSSTRKGIQKIIYLLRNKLYHGLKKTMYIQYTLNIQCTLTSEFILIVSKPT